MPWELYFVMREAVTVQRAGLIDSDPIAPDSD
jgi:hypothetical protein